MNYNPNNPPRAGGIGRKVKRVSDVAALGMTPSPAPYQPPPFDQSQMNTFNQNVAPVYNENGFDSPNYGYNPSNSPPPADFSQYQMGSNPQSTAVSSFIQNKNQIGMMLQQPMVQDMAVEFGQHLASQGKDIVNKKIEKYVSVSELKYYFAVDSKYVIKKLFLILFPFTQKEWTVKYDQDHPVQPRYDANAPDLYIPIMAYVTYVVLAGIVFGMQQRFSPEQIGIQASSALAYNIFELLIYSITKYVTNIQTKLGVYDLLAFSGYKFVIIICCILASVIFQTLGYYCVLIYCSITISIFLVKTLRMKVLLDPMQQDYSHDNYVQPRHTGSKRKIYFIFFIVAMQPILTWWLSYHLISSSAV